MMTGWNAMCVCRVQCGGDATQCVVSTRGISRWMRNNMGLKSMWVMVEMQ
jgi:hypothetical protein